MGKKGGKGKDVVDAGGAEVAEIQAEQGESKANLEGEAAPKNTVAKEEAPQAENDGVKKGKKKKSKAFDPLSDNPVKFKKIDFENALTPEEKAAKKAAKLAEKKGGKKKKEKPPPEDSPAEPEQATELAAGASKAKKKAKEEAEQVAEEQKPEERKAKKGKKGKKEKEASEAIKEEAAPEEVREEAVAEEIKEEEGQAVVPKEKARKAKKALPVAEEEGEEPVTALQKGKKGKKARAESEDEVATMKEKKGKKKKETRVEQATVQETVDEEAMMPSEVGVKDKKGKKGKGKRGGEEGAGKKDKKGKGKQTKVQKGIEPSVCKINMQMSISAFLDRYTSTHEFDDDEWTWESYTASSESVKEEAVEKGKKGKGKKGMKGKGKEKGKEKKGKKDKEKTDEEGEGQVDDAPVTAGKGGKKGKKGKKAKGKEKEKVSEAAQDTVSAATDIMAEINKMKALADAQARTAEGGDELSVALSKKSTKSAKSQKGKKKDEAEEGAEGEPKKKKEKKEKGPKKKLSKKERAKLAAEQAEQARIQAELEAKRAEEEERLRLIEERKAAIEKEKRETAEQQLRAEQLTNAINAIDTMRKYNMDKALRDRNQQVWDQYLKCDGLPDPYVCGQLNTYLHLWEQVIESTTIDVAIARTTEVLGLLDIMTTLIDDPVGVEQTQVENWKWIHRLFRQYQQQSLDTACYRLLRDYEKNLNRLNFNTADYERKEDTFSVKLWLLVKMPPGIPNPRKPPPPRIRIEVPDMRMNVLFPISLQCQLMLVRAMYVKYDHLSDLCATFHRPPTPEQYSADLYKATLDEWYSKLFYKYENYQKPLKEPASEGEVVLEEEPEIVDKEKGIIPIVPYQKLEPSASTYVIAEEDKIYLEVRESLITRVDENVMNLRKYIILGGVYYLDLFYQPPQPYDIVIYYMTVTTLEVPKCLKDVPFYISHKAPPPIDPAAKREPEEIEEEMKKQEEELDKLLLVTLTLPDHVMWLDVPTVCHWDKERQLWTTEDVHDLKHIEDKGYITFRTGRFGCFALATCRYSNLPYQAWEMKPESNGTVTLQITAAILLIEFNIKDDLICVQQLQNSPNNALQDIVGIYYKLPKLRRILQEGGVDVFPAFDTFCYVEGTCEKHWPVEKHTYYNLAQLSICYNFAWSRWNLTAGRRNLVMQMREYKPDKIKQVPHSMLLVTPLKAFFVDCTEVSQVFSDESVEGMLFYSDLYHLMKGTSPMATRNKVQNAPPELVGSVAELLIATRVMSFS